MKIKTKYSIGDTVLVKADPIIKETCPFCGGAGYRTISRNGVETSLYCQNCDHGTITTRQFNNTQWVKGIVKGIKFDTKIVDCKDDEWWYQDFSEGDIGIREEYMVDVPEGFIGNGMYELHKIKDVPNDKTAKEPLTEQIQDLECAYSGAKMVDDVESMTRIARAIVVLKTQADCEVFTEKFKEQVWKL